MRVGVLRVGRRAIIFAAFLLQLAPLSSSPSHREQVLRARYSATPPTLDGMLTEECGTPLQDNNTAQVHIGSCHEVTKATT